MSNPSPKKKLPAFPITPAKQISFEQQKPVPYYNDDEKALLAQTNDYYSGQPAGPPPEAYNKAKKGGQSVHSEQKYEHVRDSSKLQDKHDGDNDESAAKGLLNKMTTAIGLGDKDKPKPKMKTTRVTIELPRDVLTAFFLLRLPRDMSRGVDVKALPRGQTELPPYWVEYDLSGKVCLWLAVLMPYIIQWFVTAVLMQELVVRWDELQEQSPQGDFWYNTVAFAILFLYMWKDLASFYYSVWRYIQYLQKQKGGFTDQLKHAVAASAEVAVNTTKNAVGSGADADEHATEEAKETVGTAVKFIEFRLWLLSVIFLYLSLTAYSLISIPLQEGLIDKLEVSLSIFFILEVDDWAYELFIAQPNILDDDEFDVTVITKKERVGLIKERQRKLLVTLVLVVSSVFVFWLISWGFSWL